MCSDHRPGCDSYLKALKLSGDEIFARHGKVILFRLTQHRET
ncbi:hypothetical protein LHK_00387 [Laribacter hongkongensis HLHK9]|uniref:Uncharacterized protein n=1 Tax=Laribacter hongkongensis (strain HLHK9) TaxID=557598 RepID=C1DBI5_LARHH|nr:hypothetical protein LHK_00387 [Laribacter hongkongensis HLHK9]